MTWKPTFVRISGPLGPLHGAAVEPLTGPPPTTPQKPQLPGPQSKRPHYIRRVMKPPEPMTTAALGPMDSDEPIPGVDDHDLYLGDNPVYGPLHDFPGFLPMRDVPPPKDDVDLGQQSGEQ